MTLPCLRTMKPDVAVDLANSIIIVITCPLPSPVAPRGMGRMAAVITLPCIRVQDRAMPWDSLGDQVSACAPVREPVIGFNPFIFEDGNDLNQKAQETYTIFERALGDLGVKMTTMLQNASYALIQRKNSRLIDLDTLLNPSNKTLRYRVTRDPAIDERTRNFWQNYDSSTYYKSAYEPVVNRLDPFFRPPHATILSTNSFSWDDVLNKRPHIIFCNLSRLKGMEAQIMGQLIIAQIQQTIFHRDPLPESTYIPYALYIDEFQTYASTGEQSFIETLNKARKESFAQVMMKLI